MESIIVEELEKIYRMGEMQVHALKGIDFSMKRGEFVAIVGASGSGKSTLMNILGCLDYPSAGRYFLDGERVEDLSRNELAAIRNRKIGFIFQGFNLLARTTAVENVELPMIYSSTRHDLSPRERAIQALNLVGLGDRIHHEPTQLSGGQQQRVAIARALVNDPALILADEPTGNLDSRTSTEVMSVLTRLNDQGKSIVLITHEWDIASHAKRIIELKDGLIIRDEPVHDRTLIQETGKSA